MTSLDEAWGSSFSKTKQERKIKRLKESENKYKQNGYQKSILKEHRREIHDEPPIGYLGPENKGHLGDPLGDPLGEPEYSYYLHITDPEIIEYLEKYNNNYKITLLTKIIKDYIKNAESKVMETFTMPDKMMETFKMPETNDDMLMYLILLFLGILIVDKVLSQVRKNT